MTVRVRRRLSPTERFVWAAGEVLPVNFALTARVHGRTTAARLRAALTTVRREHPLLGVRLDAPGRWQARLTSRDVPDPGLRVVRATSSATWARVVEAELQHRFDTASGPLARFVLVESGDDTFDLVAVFHHLVADVLSAAFVLRDVLRYAGAGAREGIPRPSAPPASEEPAAAAVAGAAGALAGAVTGAVTGAAAGAGGGALPSGKGGAAPPAPAAPVPPADDLLPGPRIAPADLLKLARALGGPPIPPRPAGPLTYATWSLGPEDTAALLARCRTERTTLQAALCAAFARAYGHPVRIAVAADLRRVLTPSPRDAMGLYATSFLVAADGAAARRDLWAVARDLKAAIHHRLRPEELVPLVRVFRLLPFIPRRTVSRLLLRGETQGARFDISVSNARAPIPTDYGPLRLTALYGAAHTSLSGAPLVLVTGLDGRLFFGVTSTDGGAVSALCENAMSRLTPSSERPANRAGSTSDHLFIQGRGLADPHTL